MNNNNHDSSLTQEEGHSSNNDIVSDSNNNLKTNSKKSVWRDLTAYWILGLCNNYGYVVMVSAAHDIIAQFSNKDNHTNTLNTNTGRECHFISTGAILLADIIPSLFVKFLMPFVPFWVNFRILVAVIFAAAGYVLVGLADHQWMALLGIILTSASSGIGESTFLAFTSYYHKNVVSTWSSGTGGAGVAGAVSYAGLRSLGVSSRDTMLIMLSIPILEAISFWFILTPPIVEVRSSDVEPADSLIDDDSPFPSLKSKLLYILSLMKYILPLCLVYFFEYFINQGMFELVNFKNTNLDQAAQYRWLNVDYQIGVFISRSSVNVFHLKHIWLMSLFQMINVVYFLTEVIYFYTPSIWIVFVIVLWEGLLGGAAYVNTFYKMSKTIPAHKRKFAIAVVVLSDSIGIALAGFLAIPLHNAICALPT